MVFNWSALTRKQQQMVVATVILAVVQIFILIRFLGNMDSSNSFGKSGGEDLAVLQSQLEDARAVLLRSEIISRSLEESVRQLEELEQFTPRSSDRYAWAYEYVSLKATQAGIVLDSCQEVSPAGAFQPRKHGGKDDQSAKESSYEVVVSTKCGYNELVEFLWRLESGNRLLRVKEVQLSVLVDETARQQVRIVLQWPNTIQIERGRTQ
jgi:hypothetical protein